MNEIEDEEFSGSFFGTPTTSTPIDLSADNPPLSGTFLANNLNIGNPWDPPVDINDTDTSRILEDVSLPEIYSTAFNLANPVAGRIPVSALSKILGVSGQPHAMVEKILNLAVPVSSTRVNRGEFNTALALVALAQKNMDVSIETLIARKDDLPEPILPGLDNLNFRQATLSTPITRSATIEADPWAVPQASQVPAFTVPDIASEIPQSIESATTTSATTTMSFVRAQEFNWCIDNDVITVNFAPEREGFLFKHVNYIVESQRRSTKVSRRYSDFWWLMECLVKKYPFRILPALPPKKIGVNGFHFTVDESFLEKRRKGLSRFLNFIVKHPVLKDDELVMIFLSEQQEMAVWRKTNIPDLDEEFLKKKVPPELESRIPENLDKMINEVYKKLDVTIDHYRNMCNIVERMARRCEGMATDFMRYGLALNSLIESDKKCYIGECLPCSQINAGLTDVSSHVQRASSIIEDEAASTVDNLLENLKQHRDLLVSFKETLERRSRLAMNTIDSLNTRIAANQAKLSPLSGKEGPDPEAERLSAAIQKDREDIELQKRRKIFVQHCMNAELSLFHRSSIFVSLLYRNFANEQLKFSQQLFDNWKSLIHAVNDMPIKTNGFG